MAENQSIRWAPAFGYESHYIISEAGEVRRTAAANGATVGRTIAHSVMVHRGGYVCVTLNQNGRGCMKRLHRLVWKSFNGQIPAHYDVHHIDEDKANNSLHNLAALTKKAHSAITRRPLGEQHRGAVFNDVAVRVIRYFHAVRGYGYRRIGRAMDRDASQIRGIVMRKTWAHVE